MEAVAFIRSNDWYAYGFGCGDYNGYVAVPPTNKYHGKHYDDVDDVDVHGGLTFSEPAVIDGKLIPVLEDAEYITDNTEIGDDWWIFGFDTMHHGDTPEEWGREAVSKETMKLMKQLTKE